MALRSPALAGGGRTRGLVAGALGDDLGCYVGGNLSVGIEDHGVVGAALGLGTRTLSKGPKSSQNTTC